jgi:hypothetical protein
MDSSMRPMNDIDILFRNANFKKVKELFFNMDYQIAHSSAKDVCFIHKHTGILVEMQLSLMDVGYTVWYNYLEISISKKNINVIHWSHRRVHVHIS